MQQRMDIELGRQGSSHTEQVQLEEVEAEGSAVGLVAADSAVGLVAAGALEAEVAEDTQDLHCCTLRISRIVSSLPFRVQNGRL